MSTGSLPTPPSASLPTEARSRRWNSPIWPGRGVVIGPRYRRCHEAATESILITRPRKTVRLPPGKSRLLTLAIHSASVRSQHRASHAKCKPTHPGFIAIAPLASLSTNAGTWSAPAVLKASAWNRLATSSHLSSPSRSCRGSQQTTKPVRSAKRSPVLRVGYKWSRPGKQAAPWRVERHESLLLFRHSLILLLLCLTSALLEGCYVLLGRDASCSIIGGLWKA
jgi:hypothetical protein